MSISFLIDQNIKSIGRLSIKMNIIAYKLPRKNGNLKKNIQLLVLTECGGAKAAVDF